MANNTSATNAQPVFSSATTTRSVAENTASGVNVGTAVTATDGDSDTLTYALVGPDASSFTIDTTSGQIQTSASLDFETTPTSYSVVVTVRDGKTAAGVTDTGCRRRHRGDHHVTNVDEWEAPIRNVCRVSRLTASVTDIDGTITSLTWRWHGRQVRSVGFTNISGATSAMYTTVAADVGLKLKAIRVHRQWQGSGKTAKRRRAAL